MSPGRPLPNCKIYSAKAGREIAQGVRDIAVNIASEALKNILVGR
jgi:hypothetical protein